MYKIELSKQKNVKECKNVSAPFDLILNVLNDLPHLQASLKYKGFTEKNPDTIQD